MALLRDRTVCMVNLDSGRTLRLRNLRSGCSNSIVAASGLLNIPNFAQGCVCNYPVQTSSAWIHTPGVEDWGGTPFAVKPLQAKAELPMITPEQAEAMHAFKRTFYVTTPEKAGKYLRGAWNFDTALPGKAAVVPDLSTHKANCRLANPAFEPRGTGRALKCNGKQTKTAGAAMLGPPGTIADAVTLCARVKLAGHQDKGATGIVERAQFYRLMVGETKPPYSISFTVQLENKSWPSVRTPRVIKPGEWIHIAGVFDGETGELVIYLNGKRVGKTGGSPGRIGHVSAAMAIGSRDGGAWLTGAIDDVRVYDRALGPAVIAQLAAGP
jgi:hypothetical protein